MPYFENFNLHEDLSRRSFVTGLATVAAVGAAGAFLTACGAQQTATSGDSGASDNGQAQDSASDATQDAPNGADAAADAGQAAPAPSKDKILVAYFSGTGHTQRAAEAAADELGADVFVITPQNPYSTDDLNFNDENSRVVREYQNQDQRDTPLAQSAPANFAEYGTVLVGYPIWWGDSAWAMHHFASDNDFTGKTVIPFCTSYSSGLGASGTNLAQLAGTGDWQQGHRFDQEATADEVRQWAQTLQA